MVGGSLGHSWGCLGGGGLLWGDPKGWGHGERRAHVCRYICTRVCPPLAGSMCVPPSLLPRGPPPPSPATPCPCPHPRVLPFWYFAVTFIKDKGEKSSRFVPYGQIQLVLGHFWGGHTHTHGVTDVTGVTSVPPCPSPTWC